MSVRIIQLTDCHVTADPQFELKGIRTRASLECVLAFIASRYSAADYLVVTGDLTHDEQLATYEILHELLTPWMPRLRVIPGNHDDRTAMRQVFADRIHVVAGRNTFVDDVRGWKLIGLDSHLPGESRGQLGDEQLAWLEQQLQVAQGQSTCLFLHHPPIKMNSAWLDRIGLNDAHKLLAIIMRHANVRLVACGHVHQERTVIVDSTTIITSPSTGVQFLPNTEQLAIDVVAAGLRVVDLHSNGQVSTWVERVKTV